MTKYIYKWKKKNGDLLEMAEYKNHFNKAKSLGVDLEEYFKEIGIMHGMSQGGNQAPWDNSAKLVSWYVYEEKEELRLLTYWRYTKYMEESKEKGVTVTELLKEKGYKEYNTLVNEEDIDNKPTRWIHINSKKILFRKEYQKLNFKSSKEDNNIKKYLHEHGYYNILDSKRKVVVKLMKEKDKLKTKGDKDVNRGE